MLKYSLYTNENNIHLNTINKNIFTYKQLIKMVSRQMGQF